MSFDYNTTRQKLVLAEYGRHVQSMVRYIATLPTKEERNRYAKVVIDLMGSLNPHLRDVPDFKHKLWDHLHIISNFTIDVDSPYPKPTWDAINFKPQPLTYPHQKIRLRHYGKTLEMMIEKAISIEDEERRHHMVMGIVNFMKNAYVNWNKDSVTEDIILADLDMMSGGKLKLAEGSLSWGEFQRPIHQRNKSISSNNGRKTFVNGGNRQRRKKK